MVGRRAVFLDRDGVLNRSLVRNGKPFAPRSLNDFEILPNVAPTLQAFKRSGLFLSVVTNQPDVATGKQSRELVESMHKILRQSLPIDEIRACFHVDTDRCECRKPKPGMLFAAARARGIDLARSYMIGDRAGDIAAGNAAGCFTIFIDCQYTEAPPLNADATISTLAEARDIILSKMNVDCQSE